MTLPVQVGLPGGPELLIVLLILAMLALPVVLVVLVVGALVVWKSGGDGTGEERRPAGSGHVRRAGGPEGDPDDGESRPDDRGSRPQ